MADETAGVKESQGGGVQKKKKINKLKADELKNKIDEMEKAGNTKSRYYRDLTARLKDIQGS